MFVNKHCDIYILQLEQLLSGMKGDFEQLKEQLAALDRAQSTQAAELCQLEERLATASTCNVVLQCDLATFAEATQVWIEQHQIECLLLRASEMVHHALVDCAVDAHAGDCKRAPMDQMKLWMLLAQDLKRGPRSRPVQCCKYPSG